MRGKKEKCEADGGWGNDLKRVMRKGMKSIEIKEIKEIKDRRWKGGNRRHMKWRSRGKENASMITRKKFTDRVE